ncbi:PepSY domain-containing protein [Streptomyces sp. NBC_00435]|uniref:PepSY domain-containing protein n=1 Tax=Streptomyces sp. NBC_00435 TaxID=2903649 RepID=UPI002E1E0C73
MKRTLYVSSAAAAAVLLVTGPVAAAAASTAEAAAGSTPVSAPLRAAVDADGAATAALKSHPGVIESLDKDGPVWHVNVIAKDGSHTELLVAAAGGAVTVENTDQDDDGDEDAALIAAKFTAQEAMKAALAAHAGTVSSVSWDDDDSTRYWDVEVKTASGTQNVHVDPTSGKVTASHSDSNDNDNDNNDNNG